ncbi:hypothetical protein [Streptomyces sp. NPDC048269]|uniref:hypothetical protein n=1 Tax=Streptomyces sp. NPDC048269 TaxID=3155753 RepID=UPI0034336BB7
MALTPRFEPMLAQAAESVPGPGVLAGGPEPAPGAEQLPDGVVHDGEVAVRQSWFKTRRGDATEADVVPRPHHQRYLSAYT